MEIFFHWKVLLLTLHLMDNKGYGTQKEWFSYHISIWLISKMLLCRYIFQSPKRYILRFALLPWDQRIIPIYAFFCTFSTFAQRIFKGWSCNFTWTFGKVVRSKSMKLVFTAIIIRHRLCIIYAFFCTFSTFAQKIYKGWGCNSHEAWVR